MMAGRCELEPWVQYSSSWADFLYLRPRGACARSVFVSRVWRRLNRARLSEDQSKDGGMKEDTPETLASRTAHNRSGLPL